MFRSTASISFALPCTTANAGGGVTAVCTQLAGIPMMALCAVWVSHSRSRKVPEGGLQEAIPGYRGATPGGFMEKILRTFSWPVLNDDVINFNDDVINCPLGCVVSVRACHQLTSKKSNHESLERASTTQLGVFRVNQRLI